MSHINRLRIPILTFCRGAQFESCRLLPRMCTLPSMEIAQAELELAIRHLKQVEERISMQREKIARMRSDVLSAQAE
jgi:hypothetical protein